MLYTISAYNGKIESNLGLTTKYASKTGCFKTASKVAQDLANEYGFCLVVNSDTGNRTEFYKQSKVAK